MKKINLLLLVGSLVLAFSTIAMAQQPAPPAKLVLNPIPPGSPEWTINQFLHACSDDLYSFPLNLVEGANLDSKEFKDINRAIIASMGHFVLEAKNINITPNPQNADWATATFTLDSWDYALGLHIMQNDSVKLKRHLIPYGEYWSIVPGDPKNYFDSEETSGVDSTKSGFTERLATLVAYPQEMLPQIQLRQSELQLKQIGLSLFMFAQDYDERIDFNQQNFKEKLTPYLESASLFTAPGAPPGTTSFNINPNVLGLNDNDIKAPETLVMFYLGHDQKLDFSYGGLSPVCFMDGHVQAVTPEEAKQLRWKP